MANLAFPLLFIFAAAAAGYYVKALSKSGAFAAGAVGLFVGLGFGISGLLLLGAFFVSSSLFSMYKRQKKALIEEKLSKGSRRDWQQVVANGGFAAAASLMYFFFKDPIWLVGFAVSISSANADTWASELGALNKKKPIFVRNFKRVDAGTSGAVSLLGSAAAGAGAFFIAILTVLLFQIENTTAFIIFLFGFLGNLADTFLGAFFQAVYKCKDCGLETEKPVHCGQPGRLIRGFVFLNNDSVNFLACFFAGLSGITIYIVFL